jgi:SPOR domain
MQTLKIFIWLFVLGTIAACAPSTPVFKRPVPSQPSDYNSRDEDLTAVRPRYKEGSNTDANATKKPESRKITDQPLHINRQLDAALDTIANKNRAIRFAAGYRIQIYVGNTRNDADQAKRYTYQTFPELNPYLSYSAPTYRIKIGDFMHRLDAERYLQQIRQQYSSAVILAEKIDLRKSLQVK